MRARTARRGSLGLDLVGGSLINMDPHHFSLFFQYRCFLEAHWYGRLSLLKHRAMFTHARFIFLMQRFLYPISASGVLVIQFF